MILNTFEFFLMNNPLRRYVQKSVEIQSLRKISDLPSNKKILEIGCGSGYGTKLIHTHFQPREITGIDLDKRMVKIAQKNNTDQHITHEVGDASKLSFPNNTFDAVIDFAIIHHIPNWKDCLKELYRVLKPGGQVIIEDLSLETFESPLGQLLKILLSHPYAQMYRKKEFVRYLKELGFQEVTVERNIFETILPVFLLTAKKPWKDLIEKTSRNQKGL